jgi:hypothetical protein
LSHVILLPKTHSVVSDLYKDPNITQWRTDME